MAINFSGSFERKEGFLSQIAKKKLRTENVVTSSKKLKRLMKVIDEMDAEFNFYSDDVQKSKKLPERLFTNYLHQTTREEVKTGVYNVFTDPAVVDTLKGDYVRLNDKIIDCIRLYYPNITISSEVFKSNLHDAVGVPKPVRIYSIGDIDPTIPKATFQIILIDPFHLVIPSEYHEKSSREMEDQVYRENSSNELCMSDYVNSL